MNYNDSSVIAVKEVLAHSVLKLMLWSQGFITEAKAKK
jgi:hypothetical protein